MDEQKAPKTAKAPSTEAPSVEVSPAQDHNLQFSFDLKAKIKGLIDLLGGLWNTNHSELDRVMATVPVGASPASIIQVVINAAGTIWSDPYTQQLAVQVLRQIMQMILMHVVPTPSPVPPPAPPNTK